MSKDNKQNGAAAPSTDRCPVADCKKGVKRMHFCDEHFMWFKEGLINKKGERPTDFDKKYQLFMRKKAA
jgi:hypothetical protein